VLTYTINTSLEQLPESWNTLALHDVMLQTSYLRALNEGSPKTISCYYVSVFESDKLVGIALVQKIQLYAKDMFRNGELSLLKRFFRNQVSKVLKGNILVVGNLTHTGQHGYAFDKNRVSSEDFFQTIFQALESLQQQIKAETGKTIRFLTFKDYFEKDAIHSISKQFFSKQYTRVQVQPNMILNVQPEWQQPKDYVEAQTAKYRKRYRTARKKLNMRREELSLEALKTHSKTIYELYRTVSDNARFNTFILPENHFISLKQELQEKFKVFGYFKEEKLVGFYTLLVNNKALETYFLGYDEAFQYKHQLYLNMLYDMVEFGISNSLEIIIYARTAMEIKSSVGAMPVAMSMYLKHTNRFLNTLLKQIFKLMNPSEDWEIRHPFK